MRTNRLALSALLLAVSACSDSTTAPPRVLATEGVAAKAPGPWVHMISGGGQDLYPGSIAPDFAISFTAKEDAAGADVGVVTWTSAAGTLISKGTVECLHVKDNRGFVRYLVTAGDPTGGLGPYGTVGNFVYLGVEDNGEGSKGAIDRHTFIYFSQGVIACEDFATFVETGGGGFAVQWIHGNVQVR
jgi:hypothetical protein